MATLQTMSELRGSIAIRKYIKARIEEEASAIGLTDPSIELSIAKEVEIETNDELLDVDVSKGAPLRISELATLLDGEGRNGRFVGKDWGPKGPSFSASNGDEIAIAMTEHASSKADIHATSQVFTVSKSVSLLAAMDRDFRRQLRKVQREAMVEVVEYYESVLTIRFRDKDLKGVKDNRVRQKIRGIRGIVHDHSASAAGDPHFHNHLVFSNTCQGVSGRWGQVDAQQIRKEYARKAQAIYDRRVRIELVKMGYRFDLHGELVGVDRDLIDRASTAHNAVKALQTAVSAATGIEISDHTAWHHWRQIIAGHDDQTVPSELQEQIRGRSKVVIPSELTAIITRLRDHLGGGVTGEALEHALDAILSDPSTQDALTAFFGARYGIDGKWVESVRQASANAPVIDPVDAVIADIESLPNPPKLFSVQALAIKHSDGYENELLDKVLNDPRVTVAVNAYGRIRHTCLIKQDVREKQVRTIAEALIREKSGTVDDQLADLSSPFSVILGVAGGGKSTALLRARKSWKGQTVWACARNRLTASDTGKACGADSYRTLSTAALWDRLSTGRGPQKGDVLVVDEFGLLGHRDVIMLLSLAMQGVIVKALGDQNQIQPIDGSTSARIVMDIARRKGAAALDESKRCAAWIKLHDALRNSVVKSESSREDIDQLIAMLDIRIAHTSGDIANILKEAPRDSEIAVQSNRLRAEVAEELPRPPMPEDLEWMALTDGGCVWTGCDVVVRRNIWTGAGSPPIAQNGEKGTLTRVDKHNVEILFENGRTLTLARKDAKQVLRIGGVWTGDSAQGQTWQGSSITAITGKETKQWVYSALTRGMKPPILVVLVDKDDDPELVKKWAIEMVRDVLTRDGIARTVEELKREALLDKSIPSKPGEMVPWLRQHYDDLRGLRQGIEDGTISVEKPAPQKSPGPTVQMATQEQISALFAAMDEVDGELREQTKKESRKPPTPLQFHPRIDPRPQGPRHLDDGPIGP